MIVLMAFTAVAIDLGQRNQQLAGAQHAIDASVLAAAQYLSTHDGDYAGAAARVKHLIDQNLGIDASEWGACNDPSHLDVSAPNDTNCISFRRIEATQTRQAKHDIRVRLPHFEMDTIFGSALGVEKIDLAATAASNGNNCLNMQADGQCGPGTTIGTTTTLAVTTTTTLQQFCDGYVVGHFALYADVWVRCSELYPEVDIDEWRTFVCNRTLVDFDWQGNHYTWDLGNYYRYLYYWSVCREYTDAGPRETWFGSVCWGPLDVIYDDWYLWSECKTRRPSLEDWNLYHYGPPTTTSTPPATTTTLSPPTTVPTSIDISG